MNENERGRRLKACREKLGYTTRDLAEKIDVTPGTISNLEIQGSMPKLELAYKLARALNKPTDWILTGDDGLMSMAQIPIVGNTQAGPDKVWDPTDLGSTYEYVDFPVQSGRFYALKVVGDSMSPRVLEGEVVIVDPLAKPQTGEDIVIRMKDGETMIKTLSSIREDKIFLDSINSLYQRIVKNFTDIESMHPVVAIARSTMIKHR